ncbi:MAG TPA: hypothetical protein VIH82_11095 [Acidimicrobiia bacterium]|jgi:hypothetical protein
MTQPTRAESGSGLARPHFVVTGCARSATTYTARLLSAAGCSCTHEAVFGPHTTGFAGWRAAQGDSSWLAVPFLSQLPRETIVIHQVREPRAAVDALVRFGIFASERTGVRRDAVALTRYVRSGGVRAVVDGFNPRRRRERGRRLNRDFVAFLLRHCPEAFLETNDVARAARHWIDWNTRVESEAAAAGLPYRRIRVEELDLDGLGALVDLLGGDADPATLDAALTSTSTTANRRPGGRVLPVTRDTLGDELAELLDATARSYGYTLTAS